MHSKPHNFSTTSPESNHNNLINSEDIDVYLYTGKSSVSDSYQACCESCLLESLNNHLSFRLPFPQASVITHDSNGFWKGTMTEISSLQHDESISSTFINTIFCFLRIHWGRWQNLYVGRGNMRLDVLNCYNEQTVKLEILQ